MKLNIIKTNEEKVKIPIPVNELKSGTVYKISNGVTMLKIRNDCPLMLAFSNGDIWLEQSHEGVGNFAEELAIEILGQLTGIEIS